jgi:EmrB/QacA subfamily drug resistance transporter
MGYPRTKLEPGAAPKRASLAFLGLATALAIIDATIVNVALPPISRDLRLSLSSGEWIASGYGLTLAALLITAGRIGDRIGQRRMLIGGVLVFSAASLACAVSTSGGELIAARFLQGAGAAAILPSVLSIINTSFRGPDLNIAFAVYGATIGTAAALGPLFGSVLIDAFGWRWAFIVNLPLAAVIVTGLLVTAPRSERGPKLETDPLGQMLLIAALALLVVGLIEGPQGGWLRATNPVDLGPLHWPANGSVSLSFAAIILGGALAAIFVAVQRRRARRGQPTLVDLSLFAIPSFRNGSIAVLTVALGEFGILFLLPLYLQVGHSLSPLRAQLVILPTALGAFISSPITAKRKAVPARTWVLLGLGMEVLGLVLLAVVLAPTASNWLLALPLLIYGTGVGFAISQLTNATLLGVPFARIGQAAGVSSTARQVGSAIGVAVLSAVFAAALGLSLPHRLDHSAPSLSSVERSAITRAIKASPATSPSIVAGVPSTDQAQVQSAITSSLSVGTRLAALAAAIPIALAWGLSRRLPRTRPGPPPGARESSAPEEPANIGVQA